jgi:hypothetical protein
MSADLFGSLGGGVVAAVAVAIGLALWQWSRRGSRIAVGVIATLIAWIGWRVVLQLSNGDNFDVDNPALLGLSAEDVGSGVLTFVLTALGLGLVTDRREPADRVVLAAAIAAAIVIVVDRFI